MALAASLVLVAAIAFLAAAPALCGQDVVISEFLAAGGDFADEDGEHSDWIEIENRGAAAVDLEGWFLTDDPANLARWRFPDVPLAAGERAIVFASGKDRSIPGRELHANFSLSADGEFLALVLPDGRTIAHGYVPAYPGQHEDVSYGLPGSSEGVQLIAAGRAARFRVPAADGDQGWQLPGHADASWAEGPTGLGFGAGDVPVPEPDEAVNLAPLGTATQSSDYPGGQFPASLAIDGDGGSFTHTAAGVNLPAAWELDLGRPYALVSVILHNRADCCASRLRDITVTLLDAPAGRVLFQSEALNPENVLGGGSVDGPPILEVDLVERTGGAAVARVVRVARAPDPDLSGSGGLGNADEADVLSLAEVEVLGVEAGYPALIGTDIEAAMRGVNASLFARIPFTVEDPSRLESLRLLVKYDDGFAAWLNGRELARRNAPAELIWSSAATAERPGAQAIVFEEIDASAHLDALVTGTNVLAVQGLNLSATDPDFLLLPELHATASPDGRESYFREPTPGAPNDSPGFPGFVADTRFSHDRGFFDAPFAVEITTETPGAEIRYTLDGTMPEKPTGLLYAGPVPIDRTAILRARAFKEGLEPTNADTHTYIFLDDVVRQDPQAALDAGFPSSWGSTAPDYGMDPDVVGPSDRFGGIYAATIADDLKSIPTMSIVMKVDDLFGARGIYTNSLQSGVAWERPASVELIRPDGTDELQADCGIRIQGGYFRQHGATRKHSLRLLFKDIYGPRKLRAPLFGKRAAQEFDTIVLRAGANDGYSWDAARLTEQYTRDEFGRMLERDAGKPSGHGMFVHLYLNGMYWGLYNPVERPDHSFSAEYFGGEKEDWDAVHDGVASNGDLRRWNEMISLAMAAGSSLEAYMKLQGRDPDGARNPLFPHLLDVPNYTDYLIVNLWGGNWDWPWKNWRASRHEGDASTGFKFFCWDYENTIGNNRDRSPLTKNALQNDFSGAGRPHTGLRASPEYRLEFGDRVHRLLLDGGPLTPEALIPRYAELARGVERAIVAESARWGDQHSNPPLTLREWTTERNWVLDTYLPQRSAVVLQQFKAAGLYPAMEAPAFNQHGGRVDPGFGLIATAPAGAVHATLDGTDPRLPGGAVSPGSFVASGADAVDLVAAGAEARFLVPPDGSLDLSWTSTEFDDATWLTGRTGIGFDTGTDFDALIATDVEEILHEKASSIYVRISFQVDPALLGGGARELRLAVLRMKYDDGYAAYLNGERVASRNAPASPAWNSRATTSRADAQAVIYENVSLEGALALLRPGRNVLAIHGLNASAVGGGDFLLYPVLAGVPLPAPIRIDRTTTVKARAHDGETWSALTEATFTVEMPLRVTEIQYHPAAPPDGSPFEDEDFEFIEIQNVGGGTVDLRGVRIEGGIEFDFAGSPVQALGPGGMVVLVSNPEAFAARYGAQGIAVGGEYGGRLANDGDIIVLRGPDGEAILDFEYDDRWHPDTDGPGPSLVIVDPGADRSSWGLASSWRPSAFLLGSPGADESSGGGLQVPGDVNQDAGLNLSDPIALLHHLFLGDWERLPCGDGTAADPANLALLDADGDGGLNLTDAIHALNFLFLGGPPPRAGTECMRIAGCPDACR